ncbi:hypothetical protein DFH06DRAFT_1208148 [Mycena polygramma]|nr:hypothetical protein DFH06DRAFT_1208148 [Mycena polygramma]
MKTSISLSLVALAVSPTVGAISACSGDYWGFGNRSTFPPGLPGMYQWDIYRWIGNCNVGLLYYSNDPELQCSQGIFSGWVPADTWPGFEYVCHCDDSPSPCADVVSVCCHYEPNGN